MLHKDWVTFIGWTCAYSALFIISVHNDKHFVLVIHSIIFLMPHLHTRHLQSDSAPCLKHKSKIVVIYHEEKFYKETLPRIDIFNFVSDSIYSLIITYQLVLAVLCPRYTARYMDCRLVLVGNSIRKS